MLLWIKRRLIHKTAKSMLWNITLCHTIHILFFKMVLVLSCNECVRCFSFISYIFKIDVYLMILIHNSCQNECK